MKSVTKKRAAAGLAAVLAISTACATHSGTRGDIEADVRAGLAEGFDLYELREYGLAGRRFAESARAADRYGFRELELRATASECMAWLRARRLAELAACSGRLESLQHRARRPDAGVNTLVALGAIADRRPLPGLRIPSSVRPLVEGAAAGGPE